MATLIGLCIRVKLLRSLPQRFKVSLNGVLHCLDSIVIDPADLLVASTDVVLATQNLVLSHCLH